MTDTEAHSPEYEAHLRSREWRAFRYTALESAGWRCEACGHSRPFLEVHHLHYDTLGEETLEDVLVLCQSCHRKADLDRDLDTFMERRQYRFDRWMTAIYGEDWRSNTDEYTQENEWERLLERSDE